MTTKTKPKKLVVPYDDALALLKEAGFKTKWTHEKVQNYFRALPQKIKEEDVEDADLKELYLDVKEALSSGAEVRVEMPQEVVPGPPPKPAKPSAKRERQAKIKKKRPGICKMALVLTEKASEKKPMTKERLFELLKEKFPDHEKPESMESTAKRFVYWAPYYYRLQVHKSPKGFWITRDYEGEFQRTKNRGRKPNE